MAEGFEERAAPRAPTGTRDVLWPESWRFEEAVARFRALVEGAGYGLIQSPVFEYASVFRRGIGEQTDVVGKEMYEFQDRDGQTLALRPEGTASVVRAYVQHRPVLPWKAWYMAPLLRHERPQAARYRQHHQLGVEALGVADADLDVEVIWVAYAFFEGLGLGDFSLRIGSMGDAVCRPPYLEGLCAYLAAHRDELCDEHRDRFQLNPMRVFDCKRPECRAVTAGAPKLVDHLCDPCAAHFSRVQEGLASLGISFDIDPRLVRGFDYYTRTTFEFASGAIEAAQNALCGGGRYDGLVEMLGGAPTPGVGFGMGIERLLVACDAEGVFAVDPPALDAFVVDVAGGEAARAVTTRLRGAGLGADRAFDGRSMKAQMKLADRSGAKVAVIVGPKEAEAGTVLVRPLRSDGDQQAVPLAGVVEAVRNAGAAGSGERA
ncbi:MAG TPA: histidine--tRNA ligase [Acidimicrobiales bacterium]|nr:histidine--tRNA ligase [Acidimicrobiales bacterium]